MTAARRVVAALILLAALGACSGNQEPRPGPSSSSPSPTPTSPSPSKTTAPAASFSLSRVRIRLTPFLGGLDEPLFLTHAGDTSGRVFVVEQPGRIRVADRAGRLLGTFLDIRGRVGSSGSEQGLLGLAFHPKYADNGRFFVDYTDNRGDTVIAEFRRSTDILANPASERAILRIDQPFQNHNGGMIAFGRDGFLYIGMGDGGSQGDPNNNGQRGDALLGKMLRIDVDHGNPYASPPSNPFIAGSGRDEIWARGLRNPWRFSFDRQTGALFIGDVGGNQREEIDARPASSRGGENYGWRITEGDRCHRPAAGCSRSGLTAPVAVYPTSRGCAITGGYVYRGSKYASLNGGYFFADYCSGEVFALDAAAALRGPTTFRRLLDTSLSISSFGEDESGELYVVDLGGSVMRLAAG